MSSEPASIQNLQPIGISAENRAETCEGFFAWAEIEQRNNTLSIEEAAALLGVNVEKAIEMINEGILCASVDATTGDYLVKTMCVRAQMAETVPLAAEEEPVRAPIKLVPQESYSDHMKENHVFVRAALPSGDIQDPTATPDPAVPTEMENTKSFNRLEITTKNIEALMDSLDFANVRLEGSMYRIGYLEAQISSLEVQLSAMNEYRARASQAIITERKNDILKERMSGLETKVASLQNTISVLENNVCVLESNLTEANIMLAKIEQTWWFRLFSWLFQFKFD